MRDRVFAHVPEAWRDAYEAGLFTEFMEQRAPGHTALDGLIYESGMLDLKARILGQLDALDYLRDPQASARAEQLKGMAIACDAVMLFARNNFV